MKAILKISLLFFLVLVNSCEDTTIYDCDDCLEEEPSTCELEVILTSVNSSIVYFDVTIYQGKVEDNIILDERRTYSNFAITVSLNKEYTVKVVTSRGPYYIAIDSKIPRAEYLEEYCSTICYFIKDNKFNMKIKYY